VDDIEAGEHGAHLGHSPSGWSNNDLGLAWLEQLFDRETRKKARRRWRLLILDGHGSHVAMDFISLCGVNKIFLMVFPPHAIHNLQSLSVAMFAPLSSAYSKELIYYLQCSQGVLSIKKGDFFTLFWAA
jgi:hypothetical protein